MVTRTLFYLNFVIKSSDWQTLESSEERLRVLVSFLVDFSAKTYLRSFPNFKSETSGYVLDPSSFKKFSSFKTPQGKDRFGDPFFVHNFQQAKLPGAPTPSPIQFGPKPKEDGGQGLLVGARDEKSIDEKIVDRKKEPENSTPKPKKIEVVEEEVVNSDLIERFVTSNPFFNQRTIQNPNRTSFYADDCGRLEIPGRPGRPGYPQGAHRGPGAVQKGSGLRGLGCVVRPSQGFQKGAPPDHFVQHHPTLAPA